tara:strand:+ start:1691 stop:2275 length:585 start_codon:yes stop_codon:yes gene_type:complete
MRNTPLPFAAPFNNNELEGVTTNEDLMKRLSGFEPTVRKRTADTIKEEGFESAKTKKQKRKKEYQEKLDAAKEKSRSFNEGILDKQSDEKKQARYERKQIRREEKEKRKSDRRDSWADKQVLKGKYENAEEAKKRFDTLQDMTVKSEEKTKEILGKYGKNAFNDSVEQADEKIIDELDYGALSDAFTIKNVGTV